MQLCNSMFSLLIHFAKQCQTNLFDACNKSQLFSTHLFTKISKVQSLACKAWNPLCLKIMVLWLGKHKNIFRDCQFLPKARLYKYLNRICLIVYFFWGGLGVGEVIFLLLFSPPHQTNQLIIALVNQSYLKMGEIPNFI